MIGALRSGDFWRGVWRVADPKITLASVASLVVGSSLAAHDGPVRWPTLVATVLGIFALEAAKNASGELFDFDSGTDKRVTPEDRSPFSGGKRVLVDGLWTRPQAVGVAMAFYAVATIVGIVLALQTPLLWPICVAGLVLAFFYHAPPFKLAYRGLGELAVFLTYGPLIAAGAYAAQRGTISAQVIHLSIPVGLQIAAFLFINEFPDARADAASGKRTLVVRLGRALAGRAFLLFPVVAFSYLLLLPWIAHLSSGAWLGLAGLPHAVFAARRLREAPESTRDIIPAQAWSLASFLLLALGAAVGLWL